MLPVLLMKSIRFTVSNFLLPLRPQLLIHLCHMLSLHELDIFIAMEIKIR